MNWFTFNSAIILGAIVQIVYLFRERLFLPKRLLVLLAVFSISFITFLPEGLHLIVNSFSPIDLPSFDLAVGLRAFAFLLVFSSFVAIVFREDLLPDVNESSVLLWMIVFWLVNLSLIPGFSFELGYAKLFLIMSILVLLFVVIPQKLFPFERGLVYVWYLLMLVWSVYHVSTDQLLAIETLDSLRLTSDYFSLVFAGMFTTYLAVHLVNLVYLLPIPIGQDPFERITKMKEHYLVLADKYTVISQHPFSAVSIAFFMALLFLLNRDLALFDPVWVLYLYMASIPLVNRFTTKQFS